MGHRAIVAYEEPKSLYDDDTQRYSIHYSHWGANNKRLKDDICSEMPFGSDEIEENNMFAGLLGEVNEEALEHLEDEDTEMSIGAIVEGTDVEIDPIAQGVTLEEIATEHTNYLHHEALYLVDGQWNVDTYTPLWCDFLDGGNNLNYGFLYQARKYDESGERMEAKLSGMKGLLSEQVIAGLFSWQEARDMLTEKVVKDMQSNDKRVHSVSSALTPEFENRYPSAHVYAECITQVGHRRIPDTDKRIRFPQGDKPWTTAFEAVSKSPTPTPN